MGAGAKLEEATALGVAVLEEAQFLALLGAVPVAPESRDLFG